MNTLQQTALVNLVDMAIDMQRALDWCTMYYPFAENTDPPEDVRKAIEESVTRNKKHSQPGYRR